MPKDELYQKIIDDYKITGSVKKTAENLGTTLVRAQRVLITEGLWSSPTSEKIWRLCKTGMDVKSIAAELCVTEKTVQAFPLDDCMEGFNTSIIVPVLHRWKYKMDEIDPNEEVKAGLAI